MTAGMIKAPSIVPLRAPVQGKLKSQIDTNTRVELYSDSAEVDLYFTIDGTKPDPFSPAGGRSTYKYREPFVLPGGKRTVKAVAIFKDGSRESNVVTKTFDVEQVSKGDDSERGDRPDTYGFLSDLKSDMHLNGPDARSTARSFVRKMLADHEVWNDDPPGTRTANARKPPTRFMESRLDKKQLHSSGRLELRAEDATQTVPPSQSMFTRTFSHPELTNRVDPTNGDPLAAFRKMRETDFLKCIYCSAPRPSDPYARFCYSCGGTIAPLPETRMPPPEPAALGTCLHCHNKVPMNLPQCIVCDASLSDQNVPQASMRMQAKKMCSVCGTGNPPQLESCVTCEARLPVLGTSTQILPYTTNGVMAELPPRPPNQPLDHMVACTKCTRLNSPDARFCDWCGTKPTPNPAAQPRHLICSKCSAYNPPAAHHCGQCGSLLEPPLKSGWLRASSVSQAGLSLPLNSALYGAARPLSFEAGTQTVGLFFPSTAEMRKLEAELADKRKQEAEPKTPLITSVSPGRGYWRKQIDHVVAHLKVHANNDAQFRALIGEPRMAKLLSAEVREDGYELNLNLTFALKDYRDPFKGVPLASQTQLLSGYSRGRRGSLDSYRSDGTASTVSTLNTKRAVARKKKKPAKKTTRKDGVELSQANKDLIREVGSKGDGDPVRIQDLIANQKADPNVCNKDGVPVIILAVRNKHKDAVRALVENDADVNIPGPDKGNTPLHEAVLLGASSEPLVEVLLSLKASTKKVNDKGHSALELAKKANEANVIRLFNAKLGQSSLNKMIKPRQAISDDDDIT